MAALKDAEYPEMKRGITVFILMNVQDKYYFKLIEIIYDLSEVREIHSVHGDEVLLVKLVLTPEMLSSDS